MANCSMDVAHSARRFKRGRPCGDCRARHCLGNCRSGGGRVVCPRRAHVPFQTSFRVPTLKLGPVIVVVVVAC